MSDIADSNQSLKISSFEFIPLQWDTEYFGVKCAKAILNTKISSADGIKLVRLSKEYNFITYVNKNSNFANNLWIGENTTAFLTDINVQFIKKKKDFVNEFTNENFQVINGLPKSEEIYEIASNSFLYSRFFNDPYLNKTKSEALYANWVVNSFGKEDKYFVIAKNNNKISGFLLFSINKLSLGCEIELIAIDKQYTGQKIGKQLMAKLENYLIGMEVENIKVGTQIDNINAVNFYNACGFDYTGCASIYHYWPKIIGMEN